MKALFYKIEALTNMHVGSGDANYGVIDNLIQRDVVTNLPTINGSSLKGALKEFFKNEKFAELNAVFGSTDNNANYRFLSANLLAIPMRSNNKAYFLATCPSVIKQLNDDSANFDYPVNLESFLGFNPEKNKPIVFIKDTNGLLIENFGGGNNSFSKEQAPSNGSIFGDCEQLIILNDSDFKELCDDFNLPVIARNKVGENKNLWYEQVVPSKSLFYFALLHDENNISEFESILTDDKTIIHIGANATVGYGFTKISKL